MSLVQVHHLEQWGRTVDARDRLGRLLAKLVSSTMPFGAIRTSRFLHETATQLPGWDGQVDCTASNQFVPEGKSLWELGTGAGDASKVRRDFAKRNAADLPDGWDPKDTVYIGVTLSMLQDADKMAAKLTEGSRWKRVR